jgi:uncharacterized protein (TIGR03545 family)
MEVNNLILGTKRTTDGSIPKPEEEKPSAASTSLTQEAGATLSPKEEAKSSATFDIDKIKRELKIDSLLNPKNLATYRQIDTLKKQINDASAQWKATLDEFDKSKPKLAEIETQAKAIKPSEIKTIQAASEALNNAKSILNNANELKTTFNSRKSILTGSVDNFTKSIKELDDLAKQDYQNVISMARLPDLSMKGIAAMVLGKDVLRKAYEYLGYIDMAKSKIQNSSDKPQIETPKRFKGQNIQFPVERSYPKFWIRKVLISGGTDKEQDPKYFYAKGQILNITNDQRITGFPITADLMATKVRTDVGGRTTLTLGASFDRRKDIAVDKYNADLAGLPVKQMSFGRSDFLPSRIIDAVAEASINVVVPGNQFDSNTKIVIDNMKLLFDREPSGIVERIVHDVLASIKGFSIKLRMWRNEKKFDIAFETDLDDQLTSRTKQVIGAEVAKIQNDLKNKLNAKIAEKRAELEKLFNEKKDMVAGRLKEYENQVNDKLAMVEAKKKEIENRIDQEKKKQTDKVGKKAKDALKGLFK